MLICFGSAMAKLCYEYGPAILNRKIRVAKSIILVYVTGIKIYSAIVENLWVLKGK
jgi:hypothetical protein